MANLRVLDLAKSFGQTRVLERVDFAVSSGNVLAVLGASGSGKTSLLRLIAGFETAERGSIEIDDAMVAGAAIHVPPEQRRVGYVPQHGALFPHLTVAENIGFGLPRAQRGLKGPVAELLDMVGLPHSYAARMPRELSGGEQQRVAVARALAPRPKLVLLDEPFSALDAGLRLETRQAVAAALAASGATAILVTHDQSEAFSMGAFVAVLRHGRIAQIARPRTLYNQPADIDVARFLGDAFIVPGIVKQGRIASSLGDLPVAEALPEGEVELLLRPEQIRLVPAGTPQSIAAKVTEITYYGIDAVVGLHVDHAPALAARVFNPEIPEIGAVVGIMIMGPVKAFRNRL